MYPREARSLALRQALAWESKCTNGSAKTAGRISAVRASSLGSKLQLCDSEAPPASLNASTVSEKLSPPDLRQSQTLVCPFKQETARVGQATAREGPVAPSSVCATMMARDARVGGSPGPVSPGCSHWGVASALALAWALAFAAADLLRLRGLRVAAPPSAVAGAGAAGTASWLYEQA